MNKHDVELNKTYIGILESLKEQIGDIIPKEAVEAIEAGAKALEKNVPLRPLWSHKKNPDSWEIVGGDDYDEEKTKTYYIWNYRCAHCVSLKGGVTARNLRSAQIVGRRVKKARGSAFCNEKDNLYCPKCGYPILWDEEVGEYDAEDKA